MNTVPVIGVEPTEERFYKIGGYLFRQRPSADYTLEEQDPLFEVINKLGFGKLSEFADKSIVEYFDYLEKTEVVLDVMELLLDFADRNSVERAWRLLKMRILRQTKRSILARMTRGQAAEVLKFFFLMNFALTPQSNTTSSSTESEQTAKQT